MPSYMTANSSDPTRKSQIDAVLLKLPGVIAKKINQLDAYFVGDRMFACISGDGVGLRLPANTARDLQFSRADVVPFQPGNIGATREWMQINRADPPDYGNVPHPFPPSLNFLKTA